MRAILCPKCNQDTLQVIDTNASRDVLVRRRRECLECGYRFSTVEILAEKYDAMNRRIDTTDAHRALQALAEIKRVLSKVYGG